MERINRMSKAKIRPLPVVMLCTLFALAMVDGGSAETFFEPSWNVASYQEVRQQVLAWMDAKNSDMQVAVEARANWPTVDLRNSSGSDLLDRVVATIVLLDPQAAACVAACVDSPRGPALPECSYLQASDTKPFVANNVSLHVARWLAQRGLYDEVLETLADIKPQEVVDPGSLLFYRTVAHHQLVQPEESLAALVQLLEREDELPQRFRHVAHLIERDLAALKDESLDHIARRMSDVRRRLEFGRAGKTVQMAEDKVLDSLDKLIEKLEEQSQQQQSSSGNAGGQQSGQPMQQSQLPGAPQAPMQVDQKDVGNQSGWGDLPPKQREEALQQIGRDFPAHYRELVEQYFRELADEGSSQNR